MFFRPPCACVILALACLVPASSAQVATIPAMTVPSVQMDFELMPLGTTTVAAISAFYGVSLVDIAPVMPLDADGTYNTNPQLGRALGLEPGMTGNLSIIDPPAGQFGGGNGYRLELGIPSTEIGLSIGDWNGTKDVTFYDGMTMLGFTTVSAAAGAAMNFYQSALPFDVVEVTGSPNYVLPEIWLQTGLACTLTTPTSPAMGDISMDIDIFGAMSPTVDISFEFSLDGGVTWSPCATAAASPLSNPALGVPPMMDTFIWDSVSDMVGTTMLRPGVMCRGTVADPMAPTPGTCTTGAFDVDNVMPPSCTLTEPTGILSADITLDFDLALPNSPTADVVFEYTLDGGMTWNPCTPAMASPLGNPAVGTPPGFTTFVWDSRGDMVAMMMLVPGVMVRATVDDGVVVVQGVCTTMPFDVDNTALCTSFCGNCDLTGMGVSILDALTGAQIAAGLLMPSMPQQGCCDVDSSGTITVLDALAMAQAAAGLMVTLTCP